MAHWWYNISVFTDLLWLYHFFTHSEKVITYHWSLPPVSGYYFGKCPILCCHKGWISYTAFCKLLAICPFHAESKKENSGDVFVSHAMELREEGRQMVLDIWDLTMVQTTGFMKVSASQSTYYSDTHCRSSMIMSAAPLFIWKFL